MKTTTVELTAKELVLLRGGITWVAQHAYADAIDSGFGTPAVNSALDAKLSLAQREMTK